mmetsp:Transcript_80646/g.153236  ORF Transcript_80646/g.153236 Transcript_80646/m.153236 type:complete len:240 (-) Transcript_80646:1490-2209(-)
MEVLTRDVLQVHAVQRFLDSSILVHLVLPFCLLLHLLDPTQVGEVLCIHQVVESEDYQLEQENANKSNDNTSNYHGLLLIGAEQQAQGNAPKKAESHAQASVLNLVEEVDLPVVVRLVGDLHGDHHRSQYCVQHDFDGDLRRETRVGDESRCQEIHLLDPELPITTTWLVSFQQIAISALNVSTLEFSVLYCPHDEKVKYQDSAKRPGHQTAGGNHHENLVLRVDPASNIGRHHQALFA